MKGTGTPGDGGQHTLDISEYRNDRPSDTIYRIVRYDIHHYSINSTVSVAFIACRWRLCSESFGQLDQLNHRGGGRFWAAALDGGRKEGVQRPLAKQCMVCNRRRSIRVPCIYYIYLRVQGIRFSFKLLELLIFFVEFLTLQVYFGCDTGYQHDLSTF